MLHPASSDAAALALAAASLGANGGSPHCSGTNCSRLLSTDAAPSPATSCASRFASGTMITYMPAATPACTPVGASALA